MCITATMNKLRHRVYKCNDVLFTFFFTPIDQNILDLQEWIKYIIKGGFRGGRVPPPLKFAKHIDMCITATMNKLRHRVYKCNDVLFTFFFTPIDL
jgi:hypothetical protein